MNIQNSFSITSIAHAPLRKNRPGRRLVIAFVLAISLFAVCNLVAFQVLKGFRIDLTANHIYTLSTATRAVIDIIKEPITLRFYCSDRLGQAIPNYKVYATRIRELLEEYVATAQGRIILQISDPEQYSDEEDRAVADGLAPVQISQGGDIAYLGLVGTNTVDDVRVIPFFLLDQQTELEYDITKLIYTLAAPRQPLVGLLSSLPLESLATPATQVGGTMPALVIYSRLQELFEIRTLPIKLTTPIPSDIDVLMLVHPRNLPLETQYAIDQFVMRGGRALVLVDPYSEIDAVRQQGMVPEPSASNLEPFAASWGVDMVFNQVVGDVDLAIRIDFGTMRRPDPVPYIIYLALQQQNFSRKDRSTANLANANLASAGILIHREDGTTQTEPLLQSSHHSMRVESYELQSGLNPRQLLAKFRSSSEMQVMAMSVKGSAKSVFTDGPPEGITVGEGVASAPHQAENIRPLNLVIIADTDFLADRMWVNVRSLNGERIITPFAENDALMINAIESLADTIDLSSLRGRAISDKPFKKIQELERRADQPTRKEEQSLLDQLRTTQTQLRTAQSESGSDANVIFSAEQRASLDQLRAKIVEVRSRLRAVQRDLRRDVENLKSWIQFLNIGLVPISIAIAALLPALVRRVRGWQQQRAVS
jgi:ABC-type uncharacterized transport system involved in gliding motility auxiliary subunit